MNSGEGRGDFRFSVSDKQGLSMSVVESGAHFLPGGAELIAARLALRQGK